MAVDTVVIARVGLGFILDEIQCEVIGDKYSYSSYPLALYILVISLALGGITYALLARLKWTNLANRPVRHAFDESAPQYAYIIRIHNYTMQPPVLHRMPGQDRQTHR